MECKQKCQQKCSIHVHKLQFVTKIDNDLQDEEENELKDSI